MESKDFFDNLKAWSKRKHRLLESYLPPFSAKVASTTLNREVFCVDGFAGAAKYDDGSDGSPILMAKFSDVCKNWSNPVSLKIINVEPNLQTFSILEEVTQSWKLKGIVENINSRFDEAVSYIFSKAKTSPILFFIDPFGPTYVHFSHLLPILRRDSQNITELIINFDTDGLHRIACAAVSANTDVKVAQTNAQNVDKIIGNDFWRSRFASKNLSTEEGEEILLREYVSNLNKFGFNVVYYAIRESLGKKPKYHFIYCTRHRDGVFLMNDFIRKEDDLIYGEYIENDMPLFPREASLNQEISNRRIKLREKIIEYLQNENRTTRGQIKHNLIFKDFGFFDGKDYKFVVQELINENILQEGNGKKRINDNDFLQYFPK